MIIEKFANLFSSIFFKLLSFINIPKIEALDDLQEMVSTFIVQGKNWLLFFIPYTTLQVALAIAIGMIAIKYIYFLVMWILKKIPVAGIN